MQEIINHIKQASADLQDNKRVPIAKYSMEIVERIRHPIIQIAIIECYMRGKNIEDVARTLKTTPSNISRGCRRELGKVITSADFAKYRKLEEAARGR